MLVKVAHSFLPKLWIAAFAAAWLTISGGAIANDRIAQASREPALPSTERIDPETPARIRYGAPKVPGAAPVASAPPPMSAPVVQRDSLRIPIRIHEALPAGVQGVARETEPVTLGVPLPESAGFRQHTEFGLEGASSGQFRTLARWPNGNIKWLLVDLQASVGAGGYLDAALVRGNGPFGGSALATDRGSSVEVDTGKAKFTLRKGPFTLFERVEVNGISLVQPGRGRLLMRDAANNEYSSAHDREATVGVEENGPVRAVVKATGAFKTPDGKRLADYTLRLHFYKGKSHVKGFITLRNASKAFPAAVYFNSAEAVLSLATTASTVRMARRADVVTRPLARGEQAELFQGYSSDKLSHVSGGCYDWDPPVPGTCANTRYSFDPAASGLEIRVADERVNALGRASEWTAGWASLEGPAGEGVAVAMRWMSAHWPAGFEMNGDGSVAVSLFSKRNTKQSLKLAFGKHEARELMWDFEGTRLDGKLAWYRLHHPLIARAPFDHYRQARAVYGQEDFPTVEEQARFFQSFDKPKLAEFNNPGFWPVFRTWYWPMGGGANQIDFPLNDLFDYLRSGFAGFYLNGEHRTLFNASTAVMHSDDFSMEPLKGPVVDIRPAQRSISGEFFDAEHAHMMSLPFYYFLTGNEEIREAVLDYGEHLERGQRRNFFAIPETQYLRAWSRHYRNFALIYEFTCLIGNCNDRYRGYLEAATNVLLNSRDNPSLGAKSPHGRNLERGYLYWDNTLLHGTNRVVHSFFHTQIHFEAMWHGLRVMRGFNWYTSRIEELEDYLHGLSLFFLEEYVDIRGASLTDGGVAYDYLLDRPYVTPERLTPYGMSRAAVFAYYKTGNARYLETAQKLVWRLMEYSGVRNASELQEQALIAAYFRKPPAWRNLDLSVSRSGGTYTLRWRQPPGTGKVQIKYATKPIVDWLGFDKVSRTFKYDPGSYTPYFAASHARLDAQNTVRAGPQEITLSNLPCGQTCNFAAKSMAL